jgi:hypothetical protein
MGVPIRLVADGRRSDAHVRSAQSWRAHRNPTNW